MSQRKSTRKSTPAPAKATVSPMATVNDHTFMREVDDALQQEKILYIWHTYRWPLIAAVILLVAVTAGWQGWEAYRHHPTPSLAWQYYTWSQLDSEEARTKALPELLHESRAGYRALAVFAQAHEAARTDPKAADRAYGQVYNDASQPQWLREIARLDAALVLLGREDTLAQEHLSILAQVPENDPASAGPAYPVALELLALLSQRQGDVATARGYNQRLLALPSLPADLRQRAQARMGLLSTVVR